MPKSKLDSSVAFPLGMTFSFSMLTTLSVYAVNIPEIYLVPYTNDPKAATVSQGFNWNMTAWIKDIPVVIATFAYQI